MIPSLYKPSWIALHLLVKQRGTRAILTTVQINMRFEWAYVYAYYIYGCRPSVPSLTIHANCKPEVLSCQRFECAMCVKRSVCCVCVWWLHSAHQVCRQVWACLCVCSKPRMMSCLSDTPGLHFCAWGATACHCHRDAQGGRGDKKRGEGKGNWDKIVIREWEWQRQSERETIEIIFQDDKTEKTKEKARWI